MQELVLDSAVSRVLRLKFEMGLFENPYMQPKDAKLHVRTTEHIDVALKAARQSVVLLENKNDILPVARNKFPAWWLGPNADTQYNMLGGNTARQT
ncbi:hypothetical protein ACT29H_14615 [Thermophagus sp. OGC60D27]|uniref:hypothetical protein n=1 Tax=Thermophagus sp. OGC60D27 TaxID=3458415 RepID=UPI00403811E3